jgi:hypothetical protein
MVGFWAIAGRNELAVDNFFEVFFFNEINDQPPKSWKSTFFRDFSWITRVSCG